MVADLHRPSPLVFWADLTLTAVAGWGVFAVACVAPPFSGLMVAAGLLAACLLYRGLCFTHEIAHLRRRTLPGFEAAWNVMFGAPLLLPSFTYVGVHQSHHNLSTYGTSADPEYLPFSRSRRLMIAFAMQSALLLPVLLPVRFLMLAPIGLAVPRFHRWLETHASSFAMNPAYHREVSREVAAKMRRWEAAVLVFWAGPLALIASGHLPARVLVIWLAVLLMASIMNTVRVLGAHEYQTDGCPRGRLEQLRDSIDTPGGLWTELWAPVGLRYHALHHYFPGIPYHSLGAAYRRLRAALPRDSSYHESTSPSLRHSLTELYDRAKGAGA